MTALLPPRAPRRPRRAQPARSPREAQYGGIAPGTRFSSVAVDVGPLNARGLGRYAEFVRQSLTAELRRAFADRMGPGPRLVVRVTGVSLNAYAGHGHGLGRSGKGGGGRSTD